MLSEGHLLENGQPCLRPKSKFNIADRMYVGGQQSFKKFKKKNVADYYFRNDRKPFRKCQTHPLFFRSINSVC